MAVGYNPRIVTDGLVLALDAGNTKSYESVSFGQQAYTSAGTYSWTCPSGVTSVSVVCIGGGGGGNGGGYGVGGAGGGGGGGLGYKNNISVTPGQSYTVVVGGGGAGDYWNGPPYSTDPADNGGDSYFIDATTVKGGGGGGGNGNSGAAGGSGGTYVGDGGGNGYSGGTGSSGGGTGYMPATGGGGGSTGTYTGNATTRGTAKTISSNCTSGCLAGSGTGQGLLGTGDIGDYGRGGGSNMNTFSNGTSGYTGAVRIMWGNNRSYPSTNVADQLASTAFNDVSGKGNNGTLPASGFTFDSSDGNGSIVYDGTTNGSAPVYTTSFNSNGGSLEVWCKVTQTSSYRHIAGWRYGGATSGNNFYVLLLSGDGRVEARCKGASDVVTSDYGTSFWANNWNHVVFTVDPGNETRLYINGESVGSQSHSGTFTSNTDNLNFARNTSTTTGASAQKHSSVKVYTKVLTASEVQQNYNALKGRFGI